MKKHIAIIILSSLLLLSSCGKDSDNNLDKNIPENQAENRPALVEIYLNAEEEDFKNFPPVTDRYDYMNLDAYATDFLNIIFLEDNLKVHVERIYYEGDGEGSGSQSEFSHAPNYECLGQFSGSAGDNFFLSFALGNPNQTIQIIVSHRNELYYRNFSIQDTAESLKIILPEGNGDKPSLTNETRAKNPAPKTGYTTPTIGGLD